MARVHDPASARRPGRRRGVPERDRRPVRHTGLRPRPAQRRPPPRPQQPAHPAPAAEAQPVEPHHQGGEGHLRGLPRAGGAGDGCQDRFEFSPDGALLATGCEDAWVRVHSAEDWVRRHELARDLPVWAMAFAPDGNTLAVGTNRGAVTLWALRGS
ncbi:WD40 repeat domain-containing protein [Streptomyces sp. NBC_01310]|uniref:WD40 repeat domain-containing protein n=1 Tax=Streptomyces sp. NBC_01310 TaxID=2903820 RepID=UPI0035B65DBB